MVRRHKTELDVDPTAKIEEEETQPAAAVAEQPAEEEDSGPKINKTKRNMIIAVASAAVVVIILLLAGIYALLKPEPAPVVAEVKEEKAVPVKKEPVTYEQEFNVNFEPFVIPFDDNGEQRFWRIGLSLRMSTKEAVSEIEENLAIIREAIYVFIRARNRKDFMAENAKKKEQTIFDLTVIIDRSLQSGQVKEVRIIENTQI